MSDRPPEVLGAIRLGRKTLDALAYAVLLAAGVAGTSAFFELSGAGTLFRTKFVLFWVGFALLAYASFQLRPDSPSEMESKGEFVTSGDDRQKKASGSVGTQSLTRLERLAGWLPPMRWVEVNPNDRFSTHTKQFLSAVLMLATSMAMEFVFGIAAV
jgi:hypothetical protein